MWKRHRRPCASVAVGLTARQTLQHNAWDDVEMARRTWQQPRQSTRAEPELGGGGRMPANGGGPLDQHYEENLLNYHDRRHLQNEYPTLLQPASHRPWGRVHPGDGVRRRQHSPPFARNLCRSARPRVRHASGAVARANERIEREGLEGRGRALGHWRRA